MRFYVRQFSRAVAVFLLLTMTSCTGYGMEFDQGGLGDKPLGKFLRTAPVEPSWKPELAAKALLSEKGIPNSPDTFFKRAQFIGMTCSRNSENINCFYNGSEEYFPVIGWFYLVACASNTIRDNSDFHIEANYRALENKIYYSGYRRNYILRTNKPWCKVRQFGANES